MEEEEEEEEKIKREGTRDKEERHPTEKDKSSLISLKSGI